MKFKPISILTTIAILAPLVVSATTFDPNFIISDDQMRNNTSWTSTDVQNFLNGKNSYLKIYNDTDAVDKKRKSAAKIIFDASKRYNINPKVLLVTLQKEQSLITDKSPTQTQLDWATGYAVCDSCSTKDPKVVKHKGFSTHVDDAAYTYDWYFNNKSTSNIKKMGVPANIDGQTIVPKSWATAFLYTYTPHIHGNKNFYTIWKSWFNQNYPNGTILKAEKSGDIWLIQNKVKRKFKNSSVLVTRADPSMIITVPDAELDNYKTGTQITFPNYSILKNGNNYYLLDYDTLRPFASYNVVKQLGYNPQEIVEVSSSDIRGLVKGKTITADAYAPIGIIYKITDLDNRLYLIKDNTAYPLLHNSVAVANYKNLETVNKKLADLKKFTRSDDIISFNEGTLLQIKETGELFIVENGKKRKFESIAAFTAMGFKKANAIEIERIFAFSLPSDEPIYFASNFDASKLNASGFAGDLATDVKDLYGTSLPAYIVAEYPSGKVISGKNIDKKRPVASFVKIFVGYEALAQGMDVKKKVTYNPSIHWESGYSLWMVAGTTLTNKDLLNTMLIGSYNNIAKMTAISTGLSEKQMVDKINDRFKEWGATNSSVDDVTGLSEKNISTPRDLVKLFTYSYQKSWDLQIILSKPKHYFKSMQGVGFSINNTNKLKFDNSDYKILASKTGYTDEALSVLYLLVKSKKDGKKYTIITMGNPNYTSRFDEPDKIAKWLVNRKEISVAGN